MLSLSSLLRSGLLVSFMFLKLLKRIIRTLPFLSCYRRRQCLAFAAQPCRWKLTISPRISPSHLESALEVPIYKFKRLIGNSSPFCPLAITFFLKSPLFLQLQSHLGTCCFIVPHQYDFYPANSTEKSVIHIRVYQAIYNGMAIKRYWYIFWDQWGLMPNRAHVSTKKSIKANQRLVNWTRPFSSCFIILLTVCNT